MRPLLPLLLLGLPATAAAGQVASAGAYNGEYDLWCEGASLTLDLGVAAALGTAGGSWGDHATLELACETPPEEIEAFGDELAAGCAGAGLPAASCGQVADDLVAALMPFATLGETVLPTGMNVRVATGNWFSQLTGVYSATVRHTWADGRAQTLGYLLDNNAGWGEGHLWTFGAALNGAGAQGNAGCMVTTVAAIDAQVRRVEGYDLTAAFGVNQSLTCLAGDAGGAVLATVGISFSADLAGAKVP
ncbi:MAG: hypothetical protein H6732_14130 [Alphaproteobacteria bacterium]|nr:hypothetical protein [Alphaproteobacteria bacterium]